MVVIFQAALDVVAPWYQGATVSALVPSATVELMAQNKMEEDEDNKAEETDADVVKRDLVQVSKGKKRCWKKFNQVIHKTDDKWCVTCNAQTPDLLSVRLKYTFWHLTVASSPHYGYL